MMNANVVNPNGGSGERPEGEGFVEETFDFGIHRSLLLIHVKKENFFLPGDSTVADLKKI